MDAADLFRQVGIGSYEGVAFLHVAFCGVVESFDDAVGAFFVITGFDAVERTTARFFSAVLHIAYKFAGYGSAGHSDGAFNDLYILFVGVYVFLFEDVGGVTFFGGNEDGTHLHG
ncbi:hypothetical protein Barb7_00228 [Bacteroidales bacterium Barb7]|nr:hypothetical protein Barb7_00228 [Bacteroidales bacterium Barb7]